jgi:NAD(P)-dependent dehydrogenase (short-subunit alcohol dehydrogenase family)
MQDLPGKFAIVTGAGSGIGLGIATALARAGMHVALADLRPAALESARAQVEAAGVRALSIPLDVSDPAAVAEAAVILQRTFGKLHVLVNNAGVAMHGTPIEQVTPEEWAWVFGVNVMGVVNGIRSFMPLIRCTGEGGHVVNTASISGFFVREGRNQGAYAASKYAVVALSEALEQETAGSGIGVSVLCPGAVRTAIFGSAATRPERFGGPYSRPTQEALRDAAAAGGSGGAALEPAAVGQLVLQAIREGEFYIFTHTGERATIEMRQGRIRAALDRAEPGTGRNAAGAEATPGR